MYDVIRIPRHRDVKLTFTPISSTSTWLTNLFYTIAKKTVNMGESFLLASLYISC